MLILMLYYTFLVATVVSLYNYRVAQNVLPCCFDLVDTLPDHQSRCFIAHSKAEVLPFISVFKILNLDQTGPGYGQNEKTQFSLILKEKNS